MRMVTKYLWQHSRWQFEVMFLGCHGGVIVVPYCIMMTTKLHCSIVPETSRLAVKNRERERAPKSIRPGGGEESLLFLSVLQFWKPQMDRAREKGEGVEVFYCLVKLLRMGKTSFFLFLSFFLSDPFNLKFFVSKKRFFVRFFKSSPHISEELNEAEVGIRLTEKEKWSGEVKWLHVRKCCLGVSLFLCTQAGCC